MNSLPNLYSLRFFLALTVVLFHVPITSNSIGLTYYNTLPIFNKGLVAVNFFFSLSGFLILRNLYLEYKKNGVINFIAFFKRRMLRIWPLYYLIIIIGIVIYHIVIPLVGLNYKTNYEVWSLCLHYLFFIPNVLNAHYKVGGILNILWSVGVEEQFYILAALLFAWIKKRILLALTVLLFVSLLLLVFYTDVYFYRSYFFYFFLGGLLSILAEEKRLSFLRFKIVRMTIIVLFILNFFTDVFTFYDTMMVHHLFNLVLSNLLIVTLAYFPLFDLDRFKTNYFGRISYGIYMYHMIVTTLYLYTIKFFKIDEWINEDLLIVLNNSFIILLTLFVSHLSYVYFERLFYVHRNR